MISEIVFISLWYVTFAYLIICLYKLSTRKSQTQSLEITSSPTKTFYFYIVSFIGLLMTSSGLLALLTFIVNRSLSNQLVDLDFGPVALGISSIVVGYPLWFFHWKSINKQISEYPTEYSSIFRTFYLYFTAVLSISFAIYFLIEAFLFIFGVGNNEQELKDAINSIIRGLFSLGIWIFHWKLIQKEEHLVSSESYYLFRDIYLFSITITSLIILSTSASSVLISIFSSGYDSLFNNNLIIGSSLQSIWWDFRTGIVGLVAGSLLWIFHWLLNIKKSPRRSTEAIVVYIITLISGFVAIFAIGGIINDILNFIIPSDTQSESTISSLFNNYPSAITILIISLSLFFYHRNHIRQKDNFDQINKSNQIFTYSFTFLGVLLLFPGITILFHSVVMSGFDNVSITNNSTLVTGITFILVGAFTWYYNWRHAQSRTENGLDLGSSSRRAYFLTIFGIGVVLFAISALTILFFSILHILELKFGVETIKSTRIFISIIVGIAVIVPFHYQVYKNEKKFYKTTSSPKPSIKKNVTILCQIQDSEFLQQLQSDLGYSINAVEWSDEGIENISTKYLSVSKITDAINNTKGSHVIVILEENGAKVFSHSGKTIKKF